MVYWCIWFIAKALLSLDYNKVLLRNNRPIVGSDKLLCSGYHPMFYWGGLLQLIEEVSTGATGICPANTAWTINQVGSA